ncbi:synphilin-1 isoform X1 [Bombina bombina]|uniref:synphilin-1 isoform X1 n=1 Tax=Bombina bombina TaxID=8345 RepID=UPI00235A6621|nr:synphilin-1 isoform X1 [Bombina bombina]XP_053557575.1 synphilin-1 isoform X1 [Bombina bombina]XP_053557576.1 synphilin-1 isoform X1 [Bombina bombina]XP_053557577.1 synphilin-1 isoform X1 [Bombina bombina]XP_053557578.1 synphilin-1 isoform X1 [Bombina bombina]XP_053557579.1 synphilin-1 isoform X1 [Bombina bombina]
MEAPEYLDLDEIDFSDDIAYSITSLKTIPELCRRCDSQSDDRSVPNTNWSCGVSGLIGNAQKPTGIADVYSKFRPVKRVSPLKHQPESPLNNESDDQKEEKEENKKNVDCNIPCSTDRVPGDEETFKTKNIEPSALRGELEHYDLDMDEILDVPYIKSSQQLTLFTKVASEKRMSSMYPVSKGKNGPTGNQENLPASVTQYCVLSPVKNSAQPNVLDQNRHSSGGLELSQSSIQCSSVHEPEYQNKSFLNRTLSDSHAPKVEKTVPNCQLRAIHLQATATDSQLDGLNGNLNWNYSDEKGEDMKKIRSILNIVKEGQISLLPHIAVDNLDQIHDENGNNLLHVAASYGHAECLQHLTSLMGEDCLSERNEEKLTPAGLAIKRGQLECVRWMVSETEAIAELSCSKDHPSLIHYAASYGQEKILLWLLQFMQEQGISLDEVDKSGNSAVHVASQHGYLGCIQTLVEYGANVTMQNHAGEKPSQSAERLGHTTCSRYLVVVETCMSLASQVVKLTKQLKEQTAERITLQTHLEQLLEAQRTEGRSLPTSPSSPSSPGSGNPQWKTLETEDFSSQKSKLNGIQENYQALSATIPSRLRCRALDDESDKILRQLLGKDIAENVSINEKLSLEFQDGQTAQNVKRNPLEKREFKLARLRQLMQRSLSESDTDSNNSEDQKSTPIRRVEKPRPQPIVENIENSENLQLMIKKHTQSNNARRFPFGLKSSKSVDGHSPSPTSESSDPDNEPHYQTGSLPQCLGSTEASSISANSTSTQKTTSPKSALKSPSSKRRTSQNLKLRVTFEEPVVQVEQIEIEQNEEKDKDGKAVHKVSSSSEAGDHQKRPFGTFRSIMESFSGNQNNNNNCQTTNLAKPSSSLSFTSLGRKSADSKSNLASITKGKHKTA